MPKFDLLSNSHIVESDCERFIWFQQGQPCVAEEESGDRYSVKTDENQDDERAFWDRFFESLKPVKQEIDNAKKAISSSFIGESIDTVAQLVDDAGDAADAVTRRTAELTY